MNIDDVTSGFDDASAALSALNRVRHFVGLLTVDGIVVEVNRAALLAGGLRRNDVIGKRFWDAHWWSHDPEVQAELRDAVARAARGDEVRYDVAVRAADGGNELITIDFSLSPLIDDNGVVTHLVPEGHPLGDGAGRDVSSSWAELVVQAQRARAEADELRALATALAGAHGLDAVAATIMDRLPALGQVAFVNVAVLGDDDEVLIHGPAHLDNEIAERWSRLPVTERIPLTDAIETARPVLVRDLDELERMYPSMVADTAALGLRCLAAHPILGRTGPTQAAIGLGAVEPNGIDLRELAPTLSLCGAALQRALAADQVSQTRALLDTLVQRAPIGFAFLDRNLRFRLVNEVLAAINGASVEDHVGKTVADVAPDLADQAVPMLQSVLTTRAPVTGLLITGTTPATGETQRTWEESYYPVTSSEGALLGVGAIVEDISDRLDRERELAAFAERLRLALMISNAGVYAWSPHAGTVEWTDEYAALYGFDRSEEPSFERWINAVHPDDRDELLTMTEALLHGNDEWNHEFRIIHPAKGERWIQSTVHADRRSDGTIDVVGINIDITDRKHRETALAELHAEQRRLAERLQIGLLPSSLPAVEGYDISAQYSPGTDGLRIGGDWYEILPVADDDIAIVVGDVVGHNLEAAIAMAQLRHATLALSFSHSDPAAVLADLDRMAEVNPALVATTLFYGRLDPRTGALRYVLAGHHPPLIITPDQTPRLVTSRPGTPIGVVSPRPLAELVLDHEHILVAYTDGLLEHRSEPITAGQQRLIDCARAPDRAAPLADLTRRLIQEVPHPERQDDIAVLAVRRH